MGQVLSCESTNENLHKNLFEYTIMYLYLVLHNHSMIYAFCSRAFTWPHVLTLRISEFSLWETWWKKLGTCNSSGLPKPIPLSLSLSSNLFPKYALSNNHLFPYPAPMHSQASFKIKNHHDHYLSQRASKCIQFHSIFRSILRTPISWDFFIFASDRPQPVHNMEE